MPKLKERLGKTSTEIRRWWWRAGLKRSWIEVILDELVSVALQGLIWGVVGALAIHSIPPGATLKTPAPPHFLEPVMDAYNIEHVLRDAALIVAILALFCLFNFKLVARRLQEDLSRLCYVIGVLTLVINWVFTSTGLMHWSWLTTGVIAGCYIVLGIAIALGVEKGLRLRTAWGRRRHIAKSAGTRAIDDQPRDGDHESETHEAATD